MYKNVQIIAEVKTQSPFGFRSQKSWDELFVIADSVGDMLSVHTDPRWGGSFDLIRRAKNGRARSDNLEIMRRDNRSVKNPVTANPLAGESPRIPLKRNSAIAATRDRKSVV